MRILSREDVVESLTIRGCVAAMSEAMAAVSAGKVVMTDKSVIAQAGGHGYLGVMMGSCGSPDALGLKIMTVKPENPDIGLPLLQGALLLFDSDTGEPLAVVDAASITAIRTAAVSAVATQLLAREDARTVVILGAGVQAAAHLDAMMAVRNIERFIVWGRTEAKVLDFCREHSARLGVNLEYEPSAQRAVGFADIVCATTGAETPIIFGEWVRPGTHINLVGAHDLNHREADAKLISRSKVYTDFTQFALESAGDIAIAIDQGEFSPDDIIGELGDVVRAVAPGRENDMEITLFKSVGLIAQDLVAGQLALRNAIVNNRGTSCEF